MSKRSKVVAERRARIEYEEHLKDREEDFAEEKARLLAAGDDAQWRKVKQEFAEWRRAYRLRGEQLGYRGPGPVAMSTDMWHHWGLIAFDAEVDAWAASDEYRATGGGADSSDALGRAFRASQVATVAAAFVVEGLFGSVVYFVPEVSGNKRWSIVCRTLRELFDLSGVERLDQRMEELFGLRDDVAHPWVAVRQPKPHPYGLASTAIEMATYTSECASTSIDFACLLLDECTMRPLMDQRSARRWAGAHRDGVERLLLSRYQR